MVSYAFQVTIAGSTEEYASVIAEPLEVDGAAYYSLHDLMKFPVSAFLQREYYATINEVLTTAIGSDMDSFTSCEQFY